MIVRANPTEKQLNDIFELFADKNDTSSDDLNRKLQCHNPIGKELWENYIPALSNEAVMHYTEHFHEAPRDKVIECEELPHSVLKKGHNLLEVIRKGETQSHLHSTAIEQITELKMERLAGWYGLNLENEKDLFDWNLFMIEFDISPGERTLEWCLDSNPPEHTMEELPIQKIPHGEKIEDNL